MIMAGSKYPCLVSKVFFLDKFPCDQCDYKATQKSSLLTHIKSKHEGVKFP